MSQQRQTKMVGANNGKHLGDTTYTKIFIGGLAWQTQRDSLQRYFEPFGEILEAVVITDKNTGKSKGYGFVTFKDPDSAMRACQNLYPVIDGRRANCNLAAFGAQRNYSATPQRGTEKFGSSFGTMAPVSSQVISTYVHPNVPHYGFPHPAYEFPYYPQDMFTMNYYNVYGGQQSPSYYAFAAAGAPGVHNYYSFPAQHGHNDPAQGPKMMQHPSLPPQYRALGGVHVPTSVSPSTTATAKPGGEPSEQSSSA